MNNIGFLFFVIAYLVILAIIGLFLSRKEIKSSDDFVVAGRKLPLIIMIGTLLATWVGGGTVTGAANFIYTYGPLAGILYFIGAPIGIVILYFMAGKVRKLTKYTIPEILEMRYGPLARTLAAIAIVLAYVGIVSYQFTGGGYVINLTTGLDLNIATLIAAVFIIFFAVSGGMVTVAYSDFVSALLIVLGMGVGIPFLLSKAGGWNSLFAQIPAEKMQWSGGMSNIQLLGYIFPLVFLILGDQNMYQRFASAKDENTAKKSNIGFFLGELIVIFLCVVFVSAAIVFYPTLERADTAMLQVAMGSVPFIVGGIILAAAVAFMITTGDSYLLSAATNVTYDLWIKFVKPDATEKEKLKFTRMTIIVLGILAFVLGRFFPTILQLQMYSYTMYGAAITPAVLASVLWKRATKYGGLFSIIVGGLSTLIWEIPLARPWGLNSVLIAAPLSILTLIIVSLLTPKPDPKVIDEIFS